MGGSYWYHSHHDGSTALQAGGGTAGFIIIEDEPGSVRYIYTMLSLYFFFAISMLSPVDYFSGVPLETPHTHPYIAYFPPL